jgi:drug/metabolite transporter (DMT)-like permease
MNAIALEGLGRPGLAHGRLCIVAAALLWSLSGGFTKLLTQETAWGLHSPGLDPLVIAFYRVLFAGLVLLPSLRRRDLSFRPTMVLMVACFATMNALFISAQALGTAANAVLLQYTAPLWMYWASVWWLREPAERRSYQALLVGMVGVGVIVLGGMQEAQMGVISIGLGSGLAYAGVILCLRVLREASSRWLTVVNHLCGALLLVPLTWHLPTPSAAQLAVLALFGTIQMALPYWLVARGLRVISPQEAGTITLLEPLLNPWWAYLVSGERPSTFTFVGGVLILGSLFWRYAPFLRRS